MSRELTVKIIKVHNYRSAIIYDGVCVPREVFNFVWDALTPQQKDNHIIVECMISNGIKHEQLGIMFSDFGCKVAESHNIEVRRW